MTVTVHPSRAKGTVTAPPSKSMAHRALIGGALSPKSTVFGLADSKDIIATTDCLRALGATVETNGLRTSVGGFSFDRIPDGAVLPCNESGSTLRFLLPLCMAAGKPLTLCGSTRLFERPLSVYETIAAEQGITFVKSNDRVQVCGQLRSGNYAVEGNVSSQFISGLLFVLPLLDGDSTLTVTGKFESASYVALTIHMLEQFGITIEQYANTFVIRGGQTYTSAAYEVEGDQSNAAFLDALNLLGGDVTVTGLRTDSLQGDRVYAAMFEALRRGQREFDLSDCPDLAPVLFAMAAALGGAQFTGTSRLRIKESDRAAAMATELAKFGIVTDVEENRVTIHGGKLQPPVETLCGHNDHRIVMALTLLCTLVGGCITDAQAVAKSYPDFFDTLYSLQIGLDFA